MIAFEKQLIALRASGASILELLTAVRSSSDWRLFIRCLRRLTVSPTHDYLTEKSGGVSVSPVPRVPEGLPAGPPAGPAEHEAPGRACGARWSEAIQAARQRTVVFNLLLDYFCAKFVNCQSIDCL